MSVNVETKDKYEYTPINNASKNDQLEVDKYLYKACHAKITWKSILNAEINIFGIASTKSVEIEII